jgi:hypothetical protein
VTESERDYYLDELHEAAENLPEDQQAVVDEAVAEMSQKLTAMLRRRGIEPRVRAA